MAEGQELKGFGNPEALRRDRQDDDRHDHRVRGLSLRGEGQELRGVGVVKVLEVP